MMAVITNVKDINRVCLKKSYLHFHIKSNNLLLLSLLSSFLFNLEIKYIIKQ